MRYVFTPTDGVAAARARADTVWAAQRRQQKDARLRLIRAHLANGLAQAEIARALGISRQAVSNLLRRARGQELLFSLAGAHEDNQKLLRQVRNTQADGNAG